MTDHPSTFKGTPPFDPTADAIAWHDRAALQSAGDASGGLLDHANALRRGTFAEMIRQLMTLPEERRDDYLIEKAGDRAYSAEEAALLASRPDFPGG